MVVNSSTLARTVAAVTRYSENFFREAQNFQRGTSRAALKAARAEAKARGEVTFCGKPCRRCGGTLRYTSSTNCVPCEKKRDKNRKLAFQLGLVEPTTPRGEASVAGETRYLGLPCSKGHAGWRLVVSKRCVDCQREQNKPRKKRAAKTEVGRAKRAAQRKRQRVNDPAVYKARKKRAKLKRRNVEGRHTVKDLRRVHAEQEGKCFWCPKPLIFGSPDCTVDHLVPIAKGGTDWPSNIRLACHACNSEKRDLDPVEYLLS